MLDFAYGFVKLGHHVTVLLPFHPNLQAQKFKHIQIVTFRYTWPDFLHLLGFGRTLEDDQQLHWYVYLLSPLYYLFGILALLLLVLQQKPDLINAHWLLPNGFIGAVIKRLIGMKLVITVPGSDAYIARKNPLFRLMSNYAIAHSDRMISNSPQLLQDLHIGGDIISYGVNIKNNKRTKKVFITIGTAGRPVPRKGIANLQRLFPDIIALSNLPVNDLRKKLSAIDIFVAYSIRDNAGNLDDASVVVLEAMAAGCAVVVTDLPGYRKIITSGKNGFLFRQGDEKRLLEIITILKQSPRLREKLGETARQTIRARFTPEATATSYVNLFRAIMV